MGNALKEQGDLLAAINSFRSAIKLKFSYTEAWNNIAFPLQALKSQIAYGKDLFSYFPEQTEHEYSKIARSVLKYRLSLGSKYAETALNETLNLLSTSEKIIIKNPTGNKNVKKAIANLPDEMVALVHFGRSGTGLLHSLIDGHPEISTLPSIYFSEYFDQSAWAKLTAGGWSEIADRFITTYEVLFDASVRTSIKTKSNKSLQYIGKKEGMANVGERKDEVLQVDKRLFRKNLEYLMDYYEELDVLNFFKLVHMAYGDAIRDNNEKSMIFYHIHNPDTHSQLNFLNSVPNTKWVMMVREPVQSCESWIRKSFNENDYSNISGRIVTMLFDIDNILYHKENAIGVKLEDLKERPRQTIPALCKWMGMEETESLYEMTAQGKKWWGDPTSPDFEKDGMDPFGKTSIKRKVGSIFSDNDQFILQTLFHPFCVRFGYVKEDLKQFKTDLKNVGPMLDEMFDFEKLLAKRTKTEPKKFVKSGEYLYLRSGMVQRWKLANKLYTIPNMIRPLRI
jgi:hypothetical protein